MGAAFSTTDLDDDLQTMIDDLPVSVTFGGVTRSCTRSSLGLRTVLENEGLREEYRFSVHTKLSDWASAPDKDSVVTIAGTDYRVLAVQDGNADRCRRLDLGEEFSR